MGPILRQLVRHARGRGNPRAERGPGTERGGPGCRPGVPGRIGGPAELATAARRPAETRRRRHIEALTGADGGLLSGCRLPEALMHVDAALSGHLQGADGRCTGLEPHREHAMER